VYKQGGHCLPAFFVETAKPVLPARLIPPIFLISILKYPDKYGFIFKPDFGK